MIWDISKNDPNGFIPGSTLANPLENRRNPFFKKAGKISSTRKKKNLRLDEQFKGYHGDQKLPKLMPHSLHNSRFIEKITILNL